MKAMVPCGIELKELPDKAGKEYRCNKVALTCDVREKGENRKVTISLTKKMANNKPDNLTTAGHHYEAINPKTGLVPEKIKLCIDEVVREAKKFISGHRDLTELYSQPELESAV